MSGIDTSANAPNSAAAANQASAAGNSLASLGNDYQNFLKLLTIQLQNQDPTQPMDTDKMTQQLVEFTGVEQQILTNNNLEAIKSLQQQSAAGTAIGYIGHQVEYAGNEVALLPDQSAYFSYSLKDDASAVEVRIYDASGTEVRAVSGPVGKGTNKIEWDGKDQNGTRLDPGLYTVYVVPKDADGNKMDYDMTVQGYVEGVEVQDDGTFLHVGTNLLPMSKVLSVY
jgi:flagellar basal-body rod modification protein FlgD